MAESQTRFDMAEYKTELDDALATVMPESWHGHARLKISERGFSGKKRTFAERLSARILEKHPSLDAELAAEKAIEATEKKLD